MLEESNGNELERGNAHFAFEPLDEFRREHIEHALLTAGNDETRAAQLLGVSLKSLQRCMYKLGITRGSGRNGDS